MKLSILFLGRNGAGPKYAFEMSRALANLHTDDQFQVVVPDNIDNKADWINLESMTNNLKVKFVITYSDKLEFLFSLFNIFNYVEIARHIRDFKPDFLYIPMGSLLNPGVFYLLKNLRKIYTLHDPNLHIGEQSFLIEFLRRVEIKNSNKIIILNNFYKNLVAEKYVFPLEKIDVIPHSGFFSQEPPSYHQNFKYKILFLGRIEKYKGIDLLLDSFVTVLNEICNIKLVIAGKGNLVPYKEKLNSIPTQNIEIHNEWLTDEKIESLLEDCDFVVLPYIDASQSGVIPLAFGNGRTVVATNVGALSEQVPVDFGYLSEPNVQNLSAKIVEIYESGSQNLAEKNKTARKFAEENLTWESAAKKLIDTLHSF